MGAVASCTGRSVKVHVEENNTKSPIPVLNDRVNQELVQDAAPAPASHNNLLLRDSSTRPTSGRSGRSPRRSTTDSPATSNNHLSPSNSALSSSVLNRTNFSSPSSARSSPLMFLGRQGTDPSAILQAQARNSDVGRSEMLEEEEDESPSARAAAELFAHTALSLGMDNEDLLLNLMYFDGFGDSSTTFGNVMNTLQQETLALHSANNTPYKLNPADDEEIAGLLEATYHANTTEFVENECLVCRDELDEGCKVLRIPTCKHYFHSECLVRWIKLQAWCPVCRSSLENINQKHSSATKIASLQIPTMDTVIESLRSHSNSECDKERDEDDNKDDDAEGWETSQSPSGYRFPIPDYAMESNVLENDPLVSLQVSKRLSFDDEISTHKYESAPVVNEMKAICQEMDLFSAEEASPTNIDSTSRHNLEFEDTSKNYNVIQTFSPRSSYAASTSPIHHEIEHDVATDSTEKIIHKAMRIAVKEIEVQ